MDLKRYGLRKKGENCKNGWLGLSHLMKSLMATDVLIASEGCSLLLQTCKLCPSVHACVRHAG